jgi:hypothetical protein
MASIVTAADNAPQAEVVAVIARPYQPSWVDRVTDWVRGLPGPSWAFYLGLWLVLFSIETVVKWADGAYPVGTFFPYHVISAAHGTYLLALIHYLDDVAGSALHEFRPALQVSDTEFGTLRYQLTAMPARATLIATGLGFVISSAVIVLSNTPASNALIKTYTSPLSTVLDYTFAVVGWSLWAVLIYHGVRQLRWVSRLYASAPHLDLFRPGPLYAFAGLSARSAIGLVALLYASFAAVPALLDTPAISLAMVPFTLLAVLIFVAPLVGVHRILESQKRRLQDELGGRLGAANVKLQRQMDDDKFSEVSGLKDGIEGLVAMKDELSKLRTWPWQPGTIGGLGAALLLPVVLWGVQRLLERLGF